MSDVKTDSAAAETPEPPKKTTPSSGRVLPVMTSIMVVLPAPFGPMIARISPGSRISDRPRKAL